MEFYSKYCQGSMLLKNDLSKCSSIEFYQVENPFSDSVQERLMSYIHEIEIRQYIMSQVNQNINDNGECHFAQENTSH